MLCTHRVGHTTGSVGAGNSATGPLDRSRTGRSLTKSRSRGRRSRTPLRRTASISQAAAAVLPLTRDMATNLAVGTVPAVSPRHLWLRGTALDVIAGLFFVLLAATYVVVARGAMDPRFFAVPAGNDVWFEGDVPTVGDLLLHRWGDHSRNSHHPLFALLTTVPLFALKVVGVSDAGRLLTITLVSAALWSAAMYLLLRL